MVPKITGAQACNRSYGYTEVCGRRYVVEERSDLGRRGTVTTPGLIRSDYAGMSNDKAGENPAHRKHRVSSGRSFRGG